MRSSLLASSLARAMSTTGALPKSDIPIFRTVSEFRQWRDAAFYGRKTVGFVPTMGALHAGHLSLVKHSLSANDHTVVSIFVNPAQFAPHEDLATYPRTLAEDLAALSALVESAGRAPSAVFLPTVHEIYPSGITQDISAQQGTFVEVKGLSEPGEGRTRPNFFRGVATVVTKLFNIIQPTDAYFGQKDIQQAMLLRRMVGDLLMPHPTPQHLHIIPTTRDSISGLALSSRNAYLSTAERTRAPALFASFCAAEKAWMSGAGKSECLDRAQAVLEKARELGRKDGVELSPDYIEFYDPASFEALEPSADRKSRGGLPTVLVGAMWVGKTRLIDNFVLDDDGSIFGR